MELSYKEIRAQICDVCHKMWQLGWVASNDGNVSVKLSDGTFLATPTGVSKSMVTPEMIVHINKAGEMIETVDGYRPSSEMRMHFRCYEERKDVGAVLHAHPPVATGFAVADIPLDEYSMIETVLALGSVPIAPYATPSTDEVPDAITPYLQEHDAILLKNHGAVTVGADVYTAYYRMETLEQFAKITLTAHLLGGAKEIDRENIDRLVDLRNNYYKMSGKHPGYKKYSGESHFASKNKEDFMYTALTIAGSDSSGGAGIQADIKTMTANRVYAMSAITALTAQNTTGVTDIMEVTPKFLAEQLDSIFTDIYPDAIKTGMVASGELIGTIAQKLTEYHAKNIVVDPVMVATSGARLISEDAISTLKSKLLPLATVITPNIPEAEVLSEMQIKTDADMEKAAEIICDTLGCAVLLKGGHQLNDANDLLYQKGKEPVWFEGKRIDNPNTHGTGCTLSSAIASNLAKGRDLETSVKYAKNYISGALAAMLDLGKGSGPMDHAFAIEGEY